MAKKGDDEFKDIGETQDMSLDEFDELDEAATEAAEGLPGADEFEPIDEEAGSPDTLEMEANLPADADMDAGEEEEDTEEKKPSKKTKFGTKSKKKFKKTGKFGKKKDKKKKKGDEEEDGEEDSPKKTRITSKAERRKIRMKGALEAAGGPKPFSMICIECYEEFDIDPTKETKIINCPECDHPAKPPNEEFLEKWAIYKKSERNKLIGAIVCFAFMFLLGVIWILLLANPENATKGALNTVFPAFMFVAFAVGVFFAIVYERSRHEAYF